jgi:hypothetical protein
LTRPPRIPSLRWTRRSLGPPDPSNPKRTATLPNLRTFLATPSIYTFDLKSDLIKGALTGWITSIKDVVAEKVKSAFGSLTTTVIMPAGDVFTFAGLDTDEAGNLYAQVNFANDGGFEVGQVKFLRVNFNLLATLLLHDLCVENRHQMK